jgi:hypothetical protein
VHLGTVFDVGPSSKVLDRLLLAVFENLEILQTQVGEIFALSIDDSDTERGEVDSGAKGRRLRAKARDPIAMAAATTRNTARFCIASPILHLLRTRETR